VTNRNRLLVIFRNGKWDLPKGKIEAGESMTEGALREVTEETELKKLEIVKRFACTYHTYRMGNERVLKETTWYLMRTPDTQTTPQLKEGITVATWITAEQLEEILMNTFGNIRLLVEKFFRDKRSLG